jgi:hypothetical protein
MAVKGVLKGKRVAALEYCEPEVTVVGGIYVDVAPTGAHVDGNLVSAKGWPGLAAFMRECLAVLGTRISHSPEQHSTQPAASAHAQPPQRRAAPRTAKIA